MIVAWMVKLVKFISKHDTFKRLAISERNNYSLYIQINEYTPNIKKKNY